MVDRHITALTRLSKANPALFSALLSLEKTNDGQLSKRTVAKCVRTGAAAAAASLPAIPLPSRRAAGCLPMLCFAARC